MGFGQNTMSFRSAKIVCTLGPASNSPEMILRLARAGMDVARLNFSHGTHDEHARTDQARARRLRAPRQADRHSGRPAGPEDSHRRARGRKARAAASPGSTSRFPIQRAGDRDGVCTTYQRMPREVHRGDRILLSDGLIELRVESTARHEIICRVVNGGLLGEHKGVNLPGRPPAAFPRSRPRISTIWPSPCAAA